MPGVNRRIGEHQIDRPHPDTNQKVLEKKIADEHQRQHDRNLTDQSQCLSRRFIPDNILIIVRVRFHHIRPAGKRWHHRKQVKQRIARTMLAKCSRIDVPRRLALHQFDRALGS